MFLKVSVCKRERSEWQLAMAESSGGGNAQRNHWQCSKCNFELPVALDAFIKFCPECGAEREPKKIKKVAQCAQCSIPLSSPDQATCLACMARKTSPATRRGGEAKPTPAPDPNSPASSSSRGKATGDRFQPTAPTTTESTGSQPSVSETTTPSEEPSWFMPPAPGPSSSAQKEDSKATDLGEPPPSPSTDTVHKPGQETGGESRSTLLVASSCPSGSNEKSSASPSEKQSEQTAKSSTDDSDNRMTSATASPPPSPSDHVSPGSVSKSTGLQETIIHPLGHGPENMECSSEPMDSSGVDTKILKRSRSNDSEEDFQDAISSPPKRNSLMSTVKKNDTSEIPDLKTSATTIDNTETNAKEKVAGTGSGKNGTKVDNKKQYEDAFGPSGSKDKSSSGSQLQGKTLDSAVDKNGVS